MQICSTAKLLKPVITEDELGKTTTTYDSTEAFITVHSVGMKETLTARQKDLKPSLKIIMHPFEYNGEKLVEVDNVVYSVYRTYIPDTETIELYLSERLGNDNTN